MSVPHSGRRVQPQPRFGLRLAVFIGVVVVVVGTAAWLLRPQTSQATADQTIEVTMGGFTPPKLAIATGKPTSIRLVNPDSPYHTDGGGVHQFAVPGLGLDVKVQPESETVFTIPAAKAGTYAFYCDVCCGGKENPSMQGTIVVS
jgi:cytochrome c oxidase subunit 2